MPKGPNFNDYIVRPVPPMVLGAIYCFLDEHYNEYKEAIEQIKELNEKVNEYEQIDRWFTENGGKRG